MKWVFFSFWSVWNRTRHFRASTRTVQLHAPPSLSQCSTLVDQSFVTEWSDYHRRSASLLWGIWKNAAWPLFPFLQSGSDVVNPPHVDACTSSSGLIFGCRRYSRWSAAARCRWRQCRRWVQYQQLVDITSCRRAAGPFLVHHPVSGCPQLPGSKHFDFLLSTNVSRFHCDS